MKILISAIISQLPVLIGFRQEQSEGMGQKTAKVTMPQTMNSDKMEMQADAMQGTPDSMLKPDAMKGEQTMTQKQSAMLPTDEELRQRLTPLQYKVTREKGTEPPFKNSYWDNHAAGIYVDLISGAALFSSLDKYESGTGWPSFTKPLNAEQIVEKQDRSLFSARTEVRSKQADAHLGHVFNDGPAPAGLRYCLNSAALRFIPAADLEQEGYGEYAKLFK